MQGCSTVRRSAADGLLHDCFVFLNEDLYCGWGAPSLFLHKTYGTDLQVGQASFCHVSQTHTHTHTDFGAFTSLHSLHLILRLFSIFYLTLVISPPVFHFALYPRLLSTSFLSCTDESSASIAGQKDKMINYMRKLCVEVQ